MLWSVRSATRVAVRTPLMTKKIAAPTIRAMKLTGRLEPRLVTN